MSKISPSVYRCKKHCSNCPFLDDGKSIGLRKNRVDDIKSTLLSSGDESFNCHKTVYNLDENMDETDEKDLKMCYGAFRYLQENDRANVQMRLAYSMGIDTPPGLEEKDKI